MLIRTGILKKNGKPKSSVIDDNESKPKKKKVSKKEVNKEIPKISIVEEVCSEDDEVSEQIRELGKNIEKLTTVASDSLAECSKTDLTFTSNIELLIKLRVMLIRATKVCEGAYNTRPTQGNAYALSNLVAAIRDLTKQICDTVDPQTVCDALSEDVLKPHFEKLLLKLGSTISSRVEAQKDPKKKEFLKIEMKEVLNRFSGITATDYTDLIQKTKESIFNSTK